MSLLTFAGRRLVVRWSSTAVRVVQELDCVVSSDGIATLTINRPASRNALGRNLIDQFRRVLERIHNDRSARVVIIQSAVDNVFCSGADLKERATMDADQVAGFVQTLRSTFSDIESLPQPTIACIDGIALGGGLELALACDFRVAGGKTTVGLVETRLAIIPGAGGTQRLPRLIGASKSKELIFTGRRLNGEQAFAIGLVNDYTAGSAIKRSMELAREIIPSGPIAIRAAKEAIDKGMQTDQQSGMAIEQNCYAQVINTRDRIEGLAAFREKRPPIFKGE